MENNEILEINKSDWIVHKFGGTSVGSVEAIRQVLNILENQKSGRQAVVVSAMSGVTDRLIQIANSAAEQNTVYQEELELLFDKHKHAAEELLGVGSESKTYLETLRSEVKDLNEILRGVWLSRHLPESTLEMVSGYGELWSSRLLAALWKMKNSKVEWIDARTILVVESGETGPLLQWTVCQQKLDDRCAQSPNAFFVITGFIASTPKGVPTTLKRNGSDFSASIFGRLFKSKKIVIWTDVDGVYSADPRKVPEAECLTEISYEEAIELAYFGAKVIHPHTMGPAVALNIPILIKNTFRPTKPGTYIHRVVKHKDGRIARGFTTVDNVCLINVEGTGMIGVPGVAQRLFGALREVGVSVMLISQASSEHSICIVVPSNQAAKAKDAAEKSFHSELTHGLIERIEVISACSVIAMVGDNMVEKSGVAGRFFSSLGQAGVSVRAIAQGSSERNISAVISQVDSIKALRATHSAFFLSDYTISIGLIGPGLIGKEFLKQIQERKEFLKKNFKVDLRVRGIANSKAMVLDKQDLDLNSSVDTIQKHFEKNSKPFQLEEFTQHVKSDWIPHAVMVDCSSSEEIASQYSYWMNLGIHVITPNKRAGSGPIERIQKIRKAQEDRKSHFFYEATVGAGLPIITTLRDLIQTGDTILSIEGIVSGTLSFLFSEFKGNLKFSDIVLLAKQKGFTEPDPRDDLNGMDVARKLVILAREAGITLNLSDVSVESLVLSHFSSSLTTVEFMSRLQEMDQPMNERRTQAEENKSVLKYVASISASGIAKVGLQEYPLTHPFNRVAGTDNIILFKTKRYNQQPLIIQGPGAGPEVTAAGVFADLLRLVRTLGAQA